MSEPKRVLKYLAALVITFLIATCAVALLEITAAAATGRPPFSSRYDGLLVPAVWVCLFVYAQRRYLKRKNVRTLP